MSRSTSCFALPVRSSWVSDGTVSHRAIGSPPPAADPRGKQSSIRALSTWNRATVAAVSSSWGTLSFQALSALYASPRFHVKQLVPDITRPPSISGTRPLFPLRNSVYR